jgi:hypothetical protein
MPRLLSDLPINPFEDNIVFEPRDAEQPVAGLNDHPLHVLCGQFTRLEQEPRPRRTPLHLKAQLVTSAEPGYGKSHLIGRVFRALDSRATRIYLRPFQDAASSWRSILLKVAQELDRPDDAQLSASVSSGLTQLDAFAHGVTAHLLASLIEKGRAECEDAAKRAQALRTDPLGAFGHGDPTHYLASWMGQQFVNLRPHLVTELREAGVNLDAGAASAWLQVLHAYAYANGDTDKRAACVAWLKGESLSDEEAALVGLTAAQLPPIEETAAGRNQAAWSRLQDLLILAGFYRPFLFCFDQTELLTSSAELCSEFGRVVEALVWNGLNHMIIATANLDRWNTIVTNINHADRDRFTEAIELTGVHRGHGEALARLRLADCDVGDAEIRRFCEPAWFEAMFRDKLNHSVRGFLQRCAKRFNELSNHSPEPQEPLGQTLEDHFQHYGRETRAKPSRLDFDPDILRWSVSPECVADTIVGTAALPHVDQKGYFPIKWKGTACTMLFGFEDSSHWKRWESILREANKEAAHAAHQNCTLRVVFLRTAEQKDIPGDGWKVLRPQFEPQKSWFTIHVLSRDDLVALHACYDLFASAVEGNVQVDPATALTFIRIKLTPWWRYLIESGVQPPPPPRPPPPPASQLLASIRTVLSAKLFMSLDQLVNALPERHPHDSVLAGCQQLHEVKIFSTSQATALKWKSSP